MDIRPATLDDAAGVARLTSQLGYLCTAEDARERLAALLDDDKHLVLVVEGHGGKQGGKRGGHIDAWLHARDVCTLLSRPRVEIAGLVVDADHRSQGIGRALVAAAEGWAREHGRSLLMVRSNVLRARAHPFYEQQGFVRAKTQHAYEKPLGSS